MNRRSCAAFAALVSVLVGVGTLGLLAQPAGAAVLSNDTRLSFTVFQPPIPTPPECNVPGDLITPSGGFIHFLLTGTSNNNNFSGKFKAQPQGATGTDADGNVYNLVGGTQDMSSFKGSGPILTDHFVNDFYLTGKGSAPNVKMHDNVSTTLNLSDPLNPVFTFKVTQTWVTC